MAFWKLSFIMLTVQTLIWQRHHFSVSGKILEASESKYGCGCRKFLAHANSYRSYMSHAMSSRESRRSIPGNSVWSFWPFSRSSDLQLEDSKATLYPLVYLNHICVCFRAWLLAVCFLVKEPRKPKSGRPRILRNNSLLGREISRKWALCRLISNTDKQSMFVVLGWFRTRPKLWKHRWPKYLRLLANGILKTVLHHADCPNANLAASPLLCVREDSGSQWK